MEFNKIIVVSLCDAFTCKVGQALSQNLNMLFCDTKDMIEYELIDKNAIQRLCTKQYLKFSEKRVLKHIASFENVVVAINYDYLIHNFNILKKGALLVFLKLSKKIVKENCQPLDILAFQERTQSLEELSTVTIPLTQTDENAVCEKIIKAIGGIL